MNMHIETKSFSLKQINTFNYIISIKGDYKYQIYQSISKTKLLTHLFYNNETNNIHLTLESVSSLKTNYELSHDKCIKMIYSLTKQIEYLEQNGFAFYGFDLDDILIINENIFLIIGTRYLLPIEPIDDNNIYRYIRIYNVEHIPYFFNPELRQLRILPSYLNSKIGYYSLGILIVFCLLKQYLLVGNEIKSQPEIEQILSPIHGTKMYSFLKRCLHTDADKRVLLFI